MAKRNQHRATQIQSLPRVEVDPSSIFTCESIEKINGSFVAVPYKVQRTSHDDYAPKRESSCGDQNKTLVKYDPNSQRNRLPLDKFHPIDRNKSHISDGPKYPRQFVTTSMNMLRGETGIMSANRSIVASKVKFYHSLQAR